VLRPAHQRLRQVARRASRPRRFDIQKWTEFPLCAALIGGEVSPVIRHRLNVFGRTDVRASNALTPKKTLGDQLATVVSCQSEVTVAFATQPHLA